MKKLVFAGLAVLLTLAMVTCDATSTEEVVEYTDVVYSADGKTITLYLDGVGVPVTKQSRALTDDLAKMGHDYYEVIFAYDDGTVSAIARANWEIGQGVGIKGVHRAPAPGVDYGTVRVPDGTTTNPAGAVLFAGRKTDKTLLAVGKLAASSAYITTETTSVTFEVTALKSGVSDTAANSSFLTAAGDTTDPTDPDKAVAGATIADLITIGEKEFPIFELMPTAGGTDVAATYTITTAGASTDISDYVNGIRVLDDTGVAVKREPRYPAGGGLYNYAYATIDQKTKVDLLNNDAAGAFSNVIQFTFDVSNTLHNSIFALYFSIPVYAINNDPATDQPNAVIWNVRPSYQTYMYDLDDGEDGAGGCVLLGYDIGSTYVIQIYTKP